MFERYGRWSVCWGFGAGGWLVIAAVSAQACSRDAPESSPAEVQATVAPELTPTAPPPPRPPPQARYRSENQGLTDAGLAEWLATLPENNVPALVWLDNNKLSPAAVKILADSKIRLLEHLSLSDNAIGDEGLRALATTPYFETVSSLGLAGAGITAAGAAVVMGPDSLWGMANLDLSRNPLGDEGVEAIAASPYASYLGTLALAEVGMTDRGVLALTSSPHLKQVDYIDLSGNAITQAGQDALAASALLADCTVDLGE